jgi:hypothetical protein
MPTKSSILAVALSLCVCLAAGETDCSTKAVGTPCDYNQEISPPLEEGGKPLVIVLKGKCTKFRDEPKLVRRLSHWDKYIEAKQSLTYRLS